MELAAANGLIEKEIIPSAAAGFSLGEITTASFSGIFDNRTGFYLVCKRGEIMQREAEKYDTAMAAVLRLAPEQVQNICSKYSSIYGVK